ncbi:MAG: hypothetical protein GY909_14735 [Oligoflexia bacterium]|nr:hypothetical protein [Oligoflexia bacterium]
MKTVNILYSNIKVDGNELAFVFPLFFNRKRLLRDHQIKVNFFTDHEDPNLLNCDSLMISSWYFGRKTKSWISNKNFLLNFLEQARKKVQLIWADISDSTGTTQFEVLPYVDIYTKGQLLKDKNLYSHEFYSARIFGDYYYKNFDIEDKIETEPHLKKPINSEFIPKLKLGWNSGFATYSQYGPYYNLLSYKYLNFSLPKIYPQKWTSPYVDRVRNISCRIGYNYNRETMKFQRQKVKEMLSSQVDTKKISRSEYFEELRNSIINVSPFGLGEISLRDFEIIVSGGTIMKADCSHMETFPNLFINEKTYLDYSWDFSNFQERVDFGLNNLDLMKDLANNCQVIYKNLLTTESGHQDFCLHFKRLLSND